MASDRLMSGGRLCYNGNMKKILILFVLSVPVLSLVAADTLYAVNGGGFDFSDHAGMGFYPVLFDGTWGRCRSTGGWHPESTADRSVRTFGFVGKDGAKIVDGKVSYETVAGAADKENVSRIRWDFSVVRDFDGKSFAIEWSLPHASFLPASADGSSAATVTLGARQVKFPVKFDKPWLGDATTDTVRIADGAGLDVSVSLANPTFCMAQDNRKWNGNSFALRMSLGEGRLTAGETRSFTMDVRGIKDIFLGDYRVTRNEDWVPIKDTTDVKAGTALDFSKIGWIDAPAGKHGHVVVKGNHFEFEGKPGVVQRFYGVNLCFTANYMSEADAENLCTRLSRLGYNALRIHHYESELCDKKDGTTIRPEKMAQLDNLLNACIRHGIYLTTDLFVSRKIPWRQCGIDRDGVVPQGQFKELVLFHDGARRNYLDFARQLLTHVNPKTGRRWADEPAMAFLAFVNEGNPGNYGYSFMRDLPEAKAAWTKWLAEHKAAEPDTYKDITEKVPDNCWENSPQNCAYSLFLTDVEIAFATAMTSFIRDEIRSKVLLTDLSCWKNAIDYQLVRTHYDYVDDHFYVDHPEFVEQSWRLPSKCPNTNPARGKNAGFESVVKHRLLDKPFTITEFNYSGPGQYRGVGGMMLGAQAALQEFDGIWRFAWSHGAEGLLVPQPISYFDVARDPLQRATERAVTMLYLRRDMKPLPRTHAVVFPEQALRHDFSCGPQADIHEMWFGWHSRFGTFVGDTMPTWATTGGLFPQVYSLTHDDYVRFAEKTRPGDGQVVIDRANGVFGVDTPRTAGFFAESGLRTVGPLSATISGTPAAVWVSALDDAPIVSSKRLLLTHVTDVQDEGTRYANPAKKVLLKWGKLPHMMRSGTAEIELTFADSRPCTVYALAADGTRRCEIPSVRKGKALVFTAATARDPEDATCYYELVR